MKADVLLERLESVAEQLGVKVSYEQLSTAVGHNRGGLCRVKGQFRVIIDKRATAGERITTLATALGRFNAELAEMDLPAAVRECLHTHDTRPESTRRAS
jgi:hypothetical protein